MDRNPHFSYNAYTIMQAPSSLHILNYGAGAVGLGIDSCLIHVGCKVDILARPETVSTLQRHGLKRSGLFGVVEICPEKLCCYTSLQEICTGPYHFILISTKSFDSARAAEDLYQHKNLWDNRTKLILFQNGWGNTEIFSGFFPPEQIYNARVITGFFRPHPNEINITVHADAIHIGSLSGADPTPLKSLCHAIKEGGIPCRITQEIEKDLWAKMLYNCALNPLGALSDKSYGELAEHSESRAIMDRVIEEIFAVMAACGYESPWPSAQDFREAFYGTLIPATASHRSSTLQSLKAKKRTELDALNGTIVNLAQKHKLAVPINECLLRMIKFIEQSR